MVGQEHVVRALTNALSQNRLHHAYLMTGTRGVGKTTLARVMAKALNCETGITPEPCGKCSTCLEIDAGRFVDLIELDAASNTQVDQMRELLEGALYAPARARFKVYIIDEVHMLSRSAFNAMLKTLEEPPEHVKFILATTDPQKVPVTVLSRCLQFNLKQIPVPQIRGQLGHVLSEEGIVSEPAALNLIAHAAHGSMRDALSLLDQAIAYGAGEVGEASVRAMLGAVDQEYLFGILDALAANDGASIDPDRGRDAGAGASRSKPRCRIWRACCTSWRWCRPYPRLWLRTTRTGNACKPWRSSSRRRTYSSTIRLPSKGARILTLHPTSTQDLP